MPANKSGSPAKRSQKNYSEVCIVREERIKRQDYYVKNKISCLIFYKRFLHRHLIDKKLYIQVSPDNIVKFYGNIKCLQKKWPPPKREAQKLIRGLYDNQKEN